ASHSAPAGNSRWHSEKQPNEVRVMYVQIDERPANLFGVVKIFEPERIGDDPLEMAAKQLAVFAAHNGLMSEGVLGEKRQAVADEDLLARFIGRAHDLIALGGRQAHRLFDKN